MRRYLVVAHQTLTSPELIGALRDRLDRGACSFHLVVPFLPGGSGTSAGLWVEGDSRLEASQHLEAARLRFLAEGLAVSGEVGDSNPVLAVSDVLLREGPDSFDEIIVSTLPLGVSRWVHLDVPTRVRKSTTLPVDHVVAVHADA
jgi:hypothetical protein